MLFTFFLKNEFVRFVQSGFYLDFFFKKISEVFARNVFVYAAQFFGEKYLIEVLTKKSFDKIIFNINKWSGWVQLNYATFFVQLISFMLYILTALNVLLYII